MTPTWPSTAAGTDARADAERATKARLLVTWLRHAAAEPAIDAWVLRGSLVTAVLCPGARAPVDVDYLAPVDAASFDPVAIEAAVRAACARRLAGTALEVERCEVIWGETSTPGLRVFMNGFQIDVAVGDPMCVPARRLAIDGVGDVLACAPETLFGWKTHGLAEFGPGKWRAKDLFDLDLLWRHGALDRAGARAAIELAFASRGLPLSALDDFRSRPTWGMSRGGARKWRTLARAAPWCDDLVTTRERVRAAIALLLP